MTFLDSSAFRVSPRASYKKLRHAAQVFDLYAISGYVGAMRLGYRCRAYPEDAQQQMFARTFGCVRMVWNRTLATRQARWRTQRKGTSYAQADRSLTAMKREPELVFLNEVSAVPLQQTLRHQEQALRAFFEKRARYPRYKSRHGRQSATYTRAAFRMDNGELYLAKMAAPLRYVWTWPGVDAALLDPTMVTVARDSSGRWFVTFHVDVPDPEPFPAAGQDVGVDVGLTSFAVLSTGEKIPHPRNWERHERRLKRYQRRLARCQNGSANRAKARVKVARVHAKMADARRDFLHKTSTSLIRRFDTIAIEDLKVAAMVRNGGWPALSPAPAGVSTAECWNTKPNGTAVRSLSSTAGTRRPRPALHAGICSPLSGLGRATGHAPFAAPGTTGTSTPRRISWPPGWR